MTYRPKAHTLMIKFTLGWILYLFAFVLLDAFFGANVSDRDLFTEAMVFSAFTVWALHEEKKDKHRRDNPHE